MGPPLSAQPSEGEAAPTASPRIDSKFFEVPEAARPAYVRLLIKSADEGAPCFQNSEFWYSLNPYDQHTAARLCLTCPALTECREYVEQSREPYGVWGGLTPRERQKRTP